MINLKGRSSFIKLADQAVIGEFVCKLIDTYTLHTTPNYYTDYYKTSPNGGLLYAVGGDEQTQIPEDELLAYGKGQNIYGWHISDLVIYDVPKKLKEFEVFRTEHVTRKAYFQEGVCDEIVHVRTLVPLERPPQSWCYVEAIT